MFKNKSGRKHLTIQTNQLSLEEEVYENLLAELKSSKLDESEKDLISSFIETEIGLSKIWFKQRQQMCLQEAYIKPTFNFFIMAFAENTTIKENLCALAEADCFLKLLKQNDAEKIKAFSRYFRNMYLTSCLGNGEEEVTPFLQEQEQGYFSEKPINLKDDTERKKFNNMLGITTVEEITSEKIKQCNSALIDICNYLIEALEQNFSMQLGLRPRIEHEENIFRTLSIFEIAARKYFLNINNDNVIKNNHIKTILVDPVNVEEQSRIDRARENHKRQVDMPPQYDPRNQTLMGYMNHHDMPITPMTPDLQAKLSDGFMSPKKRF